MLNPGREPLWRPVTAGLRRELPADLASWLIDTDSLTRRLQAQYGRDFHVAVRGQRWQRPLPSERDELALADRAYALVRQVHLLSATRALVYARTVMPAATLRGARRRYAHLGSRPLGAMLFSDPHIVRGELEVARILPGHALHAAAVAGAPRGTRNAPIWGRRSVFLVGGHPLLVSEIFLPAVAQGARARRPGP